MVVVVVVVVMVTLVRVTQSREGMLLVEVGGLKIGQRQSGSEPEMNNR